MKKTSFTNKTNYTMEYFEKVSRFNNLKGKNFYLIVLFITVASYAGLTNFSREGSHVAGYIYMGVALLIIPVFSYILPKVSAKRNYKKLMDEMQKRELIVTTEISDMIYSHNSAGQIINHRFDEVSALNKYQNMLVVTFKDRQVLYLDLDGFKQGSPENAMAYLSESTGIKIKDEDR